MKSFIHGLALMALALAVAAADAPALRSGVFKPPRKAPDFELRGSDGGAVQLSRYRGKVVALGFGYTSCPDVCPTTLQYLAKARKQLGAEGADLQVLYVTVDPERDSLERMRQYMSAFDASFLGVSGTPAQLADVRKAYGVQVSRQQVAGKPSEYWVHHTSSIFLVDREGNLRAMMPYGVGADDMAHDLHALLAK